MHSGHLQGQLEDAVTSLFSFDGIVLVTQSHDTLPAELDSLKAPLQDYSSVSRLRRGSVSELHRQSPDLLVCLFLSLARWTAGWERMWWS